MHFQHRELVLETSTEANMRCVGSFQEQLLLIHRAQDDKHISEAPSLGFYQKKNNKPGFSQGIFCLGKSQAVIPWMYK